MKPLIKDKKGDVTAVITILVWLFIFGIFVLVFILFATNISNSLRQSVIAEDPTTNSSITSFENYATNSVPYGYLILFFGFILGLIVSSFFIREYPILIPIYIFFGIVTILVAVALGNAWQFVSDNPALSDYIELNTSTRIMDLIMNNTVKIAAVLFILGLIIIFAKPYPTSGGEPF